MKQQERMRRYRQQYPEKSLAYDAKRRARAKGVPCTIDAAYVRTLLDAGWVCAYCETPVGSYVGGARPLSVSLDRLIPELGYVPGNVVLACHACNSVKGEHTPESLRAWADKIEALITRQNPKEPDGTQGPQ